MKIHGGLFYRAMKQRSGAWKNGWRVKKKGETLSSPVNTGMTSLSGNEKKKKKKKSKSG